MGLTLLLEPIRRFLRLSWAEDEEREGLGELTAEELLEFEEYSRGLMVARLPRVGWWFALVVIILWPTDLRYWGTDLGLVVHLALFRLELLAMLLGYVALTRFVPVARRRPVLLASAVFTLAVFVVAREVSTFASPGSHFFASMYFISCTTLVALMRFWHRVVVSFGISIAAFCGFFVRDTSYLDDPLLGSIIAQIVFATSFSVFVGHMVQRAHHKIFMQQAKLREKKDEIERLNASLEERVAEQTQELRALTQRIENVVEEERTFVAREVHDQLGQELTAMKFALAYARSRITDRAGSIAVGELEQLLDRTDETMRRILARLRPMVVEQLGFVEAAGLRLEALASAAGLDWELRVPPEELELEGILAAGLFSMFQEGMNNVVRHAEASTLTVSLEDEGDELVLTVSDDGVGIPRDHERSATSVGMIGIRERASAFGGSARWESPTSGGTRMIVRVPKPETGMDSGEQESTR